MQYNGVMIWTFEINAAVHLNIEPLLDITLKLPIGRPAIRTLSEKGNDETGLDSSAAATSDHANIDAPRIKLASAAKSQYCIGQRCRRLPEWRLPAALIAD
jgi:hypothetical protein